MAHDREAQEFIDMAAAALIEIDQLKFEERFELLVRCPDRDLLIAKPGARPGRSSAA